MPQTLILLAVAMSLRAHVPKKVYTLVPKYLYKGLLEGKSIYYSLGAWTLRP